MPVNFRKPAEQVEALQSIAPVSRQQKIDLLMEDRLDPACSIRPVMKNILLKGWKGFDNMTEEELDALLPEKEAEELKNMLPVAVNKAESP